MTPSGVKGEHQTIHSGRSPMVRSGKQMEPGLRTGYLARAQHFLTEQCGQWSDRKIRVNKTKGARNVEAVLLKLGCDGETGGGDESTTYIYAYLKSSNTNP